MRIWTIVTGEPSPVDGQATRLLRTGLLAKTLAARGHDVVWFNGTFNHNTKTERFAANTVLPPDGRLTQAFMYGRPYAGNVSIARILNHCDAAKSFRAIARDMAAPDVIVCSYPPIELASAVAQYAQAHHIPYVLDYRDLWPDIIADVAPRFLRPLARLAMWPWYNAARQSAQRAAGIVGVTKPFLDWACGFTGRKADGRDRVFHLANGVEAHDLSAAQNYWDGLGVRDTTFNFVFSGTLSRRMDLDTLVEAALLLPPDMRDKIRIVICGKGEVEESLKAQAANAPHIIFAGWRNQAELQALMQRSKIGLLPYKSSRDFIWSYPNKVGEYFSAGLPILTCLKGEITKLIAAEHCGMIYTEGDAASCAACITKLASMDNISAMQNAARAVYTQDFDARKIYTDYADYVESIAHKKAQR